MNEYDQQADEFLKSTNTSLSIKLAEKQSPPNWVSDAHGLKYECTLSNGKGSYTFDFWSSIHDAEPVRMLEEWNTTQETSLLFKLKDLLEKRKIKSTSRIISSGWIVNPKKILQDINASILPSSYSVLACMDVLYEDTFKDFCSSLGYDEDSKKAEKIYNACIEQDRQLRRIFTHEQLGQLQEIN